MVEYVVQEGDSLSLIAEQVLGDENRWPEIYAANAETIGSNPNVIFPGTLLIVGTADEMPPPFPWGWVIGLTGIAGLLYYKGVM